jgi:hypothetical protein
MSHIYNQANINNTTFFVGSDQISDSAYINVALRWIVPQKAVNTLFAFSFISIHQRSFVGGKPYMLTVESEKIILYTLNYKIATPVSFQLMINPNITDEGNDKITRLDGGDISGSGTTFTITNDDGVALDSSEIPVNVFASNVAENATSPCPFLLFRRADIA